jgi:hypothetical protein
VQDFDRLGSFYLGKAFDSETKSETDELLLYDSGDLTTHAVIIGMTGSGKTGLGISMIEEAALDRIPVIAIDPKGDLGNIMLTFPDLDARSFEPWVNPQSAAAAGKTVEEFAADQAKLWKNGLAEWGQTPDRIRRLKESAETAIYTPGSSAGIPISVLQTFRSPPAEIRDDPDLFNERLTSTATGVLALLDIDADPLTSREHILISTLLQHAWEKDRSIDLPGLIQAIQEPPVAKIGVMAMDQFFRPKDRFKLAMQLNNLLAAPGFDVWMQGAALDAQELFYTQEGKPRISVVSIAGLNDSQRMFFVTMLLNEIVSWMRRQSGTGSLRAVLYMDEIFGYLPPLGNPPSKTLFLTLLKQARAYGLGLVLATQNPVDLDYKALSNAGTWFIGRLQTERDKSRVMEGLDGAGSGAKFDRQKIKQTLAGLGKRRFLLHNVHEDRAVVFTTRWVMSYLAGPFTRDQIKRLMEDSRKTGQTVETPAPPPDDGTALSHKPVLPPEVMQAYLPLNSSTRAGAEAVYYPSLLGAAEVTYHNARYQVSTQRTIVASLEIDDGPVPVDWDQAEVLDIGPPDLADTGIAGARYLPFAQAAGDAGNYRKWQHDFLAWIRNDHPLLLYKSPTFGMISDPGETEGQFRARLQVKAREQRDVEVKRLREKFDKKIETVEKRVLRAQQKVDLEQSQATQSKIDTALSVGTAILGAFMGRKRSSLDSAGSAIRKVGRMRKESSDTVIAQEALNEAQTELKSLNEELETDLAGIPENLDAQSEALDTITIRPRTADINVQYFGIAWQPRLRGAP